MQEEFINTGQSGVAVQPIRFYLQMVQLNFENEREAYWLPCKAIPDFVSSSFYKFPSLCLNRAVATA